MAANWTSSDLALTVAVAPGPRFGLRLQDALRNAVRRGVLPAGDALPSTRELADSLGVARGTIVSAYEQLSAEGYLVAHGGGRTRVSSTASPSTPGTAPASPSARPRFDLRPGVPDLRRFPADDWAWAYAAATRGAGSADLDYGDGRGHPHAREVVSAHLRRVRAADVAAEHIVLASGFAQCVGLLFAVLASRGVRRLAVEDPGDRSIDGPAHGAGIVLDPIPVDEDGIDVERLASSGADAVLLTPAHQAPTGAVLSAERRIALVEWAASTGAWIIEDDYDSEFRYDRRPIGAVQGLAPDRAILIGSASKSHAPGVRLAWMAVPSSLVDDVAAMRLAADRGGSVLDQLALAALVDSGRHDRHVRAMRGVYATRRSVLVAALARARSPLALTGVSAGFHGLLALPPGVDERGVLAGAPGSSLRLVGLAPSTRGRTDLAPSLALGFGNVDDESLIEAIGRLDELVAADDRVSRHPGTMA